MRTVCMLLGTSFGLGGCFGETTSQYRPTDIVRTLPPQKEIQASTEAATRVDSLGRGILAHNPRIGIRPLFRTVGSPEPEIFHRGFTEIVVTQKLVEMCTTDAELAAVLSLELAKMITEREAVAMRNGQKAPPLDPGLPRAVTFEQFWQAELARFEKDNGGPAGLPDPRELARTYVENAGFRPESVDQVRTQLRAAERNSTLEKQMSRQSNPPTPFQPPR